MLRIENAYWRPRTSYNVKNKLLEIIADKNLDAFRNLLSHDLSEQDLNNIDRLQDLDFLKESITDLRLDLGLVSNSTTDLLLPLLRSSALRYSIRLNIIKHDYGQALESVHKHGSFSDHDLDLLLIAFDHKMFEGTDELALVTLKNAMKNFNIPIIVQTVPNRINDIFGNTDFKNETSQKLIHQFNENIRNGNLSGDIDLVVDISQLANTIGLNDWYDERLYNLAKIPFSSKYLPLYAEKVTRAIACLKGKTGKCLVLDLDNTLWGGVIGDDGINDIRIGQGSPEGEAFIDFQRTIKSLKERGVILAVCSKNDKENAVEPFRIHHDMLLKEDDITIFVANWNDKASNIRYIAESLNIGLDSLVFIDDNPAERDLIRQTLPEVNVIEMPEDPAYFSRTLLASGAFESLSVTSDDRKKAEQYAIRQKGIELELSSGDYDNYLESLEMSCHLQSFDTINRARITQLVNKTNQFNLTTRRYTEEEIKGFEESENTITLQVRLKDKFGDHGIVSIIIAKIIGEILYIDTYLMSCRVLKRDLEYFLMNHLVEIAKTRNILFIHGEYIETRKNGIVRSLYEEMGFENTNDIWTISTNKYSNIQNHIKLHCK